MRERGHTVDPRDAFREGAALEGAVSLTAEEELRARVRQQEATGRLGLAALSGTSLADLLDEAVNVAAEVLSVEYCGIL